MPEERAEAQDGAPPPRRAPLPTWASLLTLVALLGGGAALALRLPAREDVEARGGTKAIEIVRDVLTGRLTDERGVPRAPLTGPGSEDAPLRLRFVPSGDKAQAGTSVERMVQFLHRRTGYHVEGATLRSYGFVVQEVVQGTCDVAFLTAASYARARYATENNEREGDEIEAFLQVVREGSPDHPGSDLAYRAALIVRNDSPIAQVTDLTPDHTVAMGGRTSGASSILPTALFRQLDLRPRVQRYEGYPFIVMSVLQGATDVGCVWWSPPSDLLPENDARVLVRSSHPDVFEKTRIIGMTPWIPNEPVVIRSAISSEIRHTLARALTLYLALRTLSEEGRQELVSVGSPIAFLPATNTDFAPLMEVIEQAFADDPEGRGDFMRGSR